MRCALAAQTQRSSGSRSSDAGRPARGGPGRAAGATEALASAARLARLKRRHRGSGGHAAGRQRRAARPGLGLLPPRQGPRGVALLPPHRPLARHGRPVRAGAHAAAAYLAAGQPGAPGAAAALRQTAGRPHAGAQHRQPGRPPQPGDPAGSRRAGRGPADAHARPADRAEPDGGVHRRPGWRLLAAGAAAAAAQAAPMHCRRRRAGPGRPAQQRRAGGAEPGVRLGGAVGGPGAAALPQGTAGGQDAAWLGR
jgi:hypothetical protein